MRAPLSWIQDYLPLKQSPEKIADLLTLAGLEVDAIEPAPLGFDNVVVAEVKKTAPHPQADSLQIAEVFDGESLVTVVCADPKCRAGMRTALAKIGATLTTEEGKRVKIKKTKLRTITSYGMLCSEKELGLSENGSTIMDFDSSFSAGTCLEKIYGDTIFVISLTPNLGHCMSMLGIARELSALLSIPIKTGDLLEPSPLDQKESARDQNLQIGPVDHKLATSYHCALIENCAVAPSPTWLQKRLQNAGIHCVNNVVDITNYIMLDLGQPLHAFDYKTLPSKTLSVSPTASPCSLHLLDGKTRPIPEKTGVVFAGNTPIAIAGVMGSAATQVQQTTQTVLIEAAAFTAQSVRKSSKLTQLRTEASSRFEKGIDPQMTQLALKKAVAMIEQLTKGCAAKGMRRSYNACATKPKTLRCYVDKVNQILGTTLNANEVEQFLSRLNLRPIPLDKNSFTVTIPSYRNDLHAQIDLIEEIARLFGYNQIPRGRAKAPLNTLDHSPLFLMEQKVRSILLNEGLQEFLTCDLISPSEEKRFAEANLVGTETVGVLRPSSVDQSVLRTSILPSILRSVKLNFQVKQFSLAAFEIGRVHFKNTLNEPHQYCERPMAAIILTGNTRPHHWKEKPRSVDFFDVKGIIENLLYQLEIRNPRFVKKSLARFHPQKQAQIEVGSSKIGAIGQIAPEKLLELDIETPIFFGELDILDLLAAINHRKQMSPLPLYPESERDWTLTLPATLSVADVIDLTQSIPSKLLKAVAVKDLYESTSLTLRFTYRNDQQTMTSDQVEKEHHRIMEAVTKKLSHAQPT